MSSFRQTVNCRRPSGGAYNASGIYGETGFTTFDIQASIQPARPSDLESLPEGRRESQAYRIYTGTQLQHVQADQNPDQVQLYGEWFEVVGSAPWQNNVIDHYKYIVTKLGAR